MVGGHPSRLTSVGGPPFPGVRVLVLKVVPRGALSRVAASGVIHEPQEGRTDTVENDIPPAETRGRPGLRNNHGNTHFQICDSWIHDNIVLNKK